MKSRLMLIVIVVFFMFACDMPFRVDPDTGSDEIKVESKSKEKIYPGYIETIDTPGNAVHIFSRCYSGAKYLIAISGSKFVTEDRRHTVTIMYGADGKILACNNR